MYWGIFMIKTRLTRLWVDEKVKVKTLNIIVIEPPGTSHKAAVFTSDLGDISLFASAHEALFG